MKRFIAGMMAALALSLALSGCGRQDASKAAAGAGASAQQVKPETVAEQYFRSIIKGDDDAALKLVFMDGIKDTAGFNKMMKSIFTNARKLMVKAGGMESIEVDPAKTRYFNQNPQNPQAPVEIQASDVKPMSIASVSVMIKVKNYPEPSGDYVQLVNVGGDWKVVIKGGEAFAR